MSKKCRAYSESKLGLEPSDNRKAFYAGWEAALAEPDLSRCPNCKGPADNGHDRCIPPNVYWCTKCMTEYFGSNPPKPSEEVQSTHSADCYKWHHECAIARVEELKLLCEEMLSELYVYRASEHLKDAAAAIRARREK